MFKNIFQNQVQTNAKSIVYEATDFCFEHAILDIESVMEDFYFEANDNHMNAMYVGLKADNCDILEEGLKDFVDSSVEFFKRLIQKFKDFIKKVFMYLNAYIGDFNKFVTRYRKELLSKDPDFNIKGNDFTIPNNVPDMSVIDDLLSEYNSEIAHVGSMTKAEIIKQRNKIMSNDNMDSVRGKILGLSQKIQKDDFSEEAKKVFRNGEDSDKDININKEKVSDIVNNYNIFVKDYNNAKKQKDKMISLLENIKSFFQKSASLQYVEGKKSISASNVRRNDSGTSLVKTGDNVEDFNSDKLLIYNAYFNFKFAYAKEVSTLCLNVMTERVNVLKQQLKQSKEILRKTLTSGTETEKED